MKPILYVGNRNYSSWSMRPWMVLTWGEIDFEERVIKLGPDGGERRQPDIVAVSPAGTVPVLHVGDDVIYDSLAISEWAAEQVKSLWPRDESARALARAAACEMHAGFAALREALPCNVRRRAEPRVLSELVLRDVARIEQLWSALRGRFGAGGPYLFGAAPTIADAFFTPVATRFRTYDVPLGDEARAYVANLLANPAFRSWEAAAIAETWTLPASDAA
jgi:glutathione S-transferase